MEPDLNAFRSFLLKKYPKRAKEIESFVKQKQTEELGRQGVVDIGEIAKTDPGAALRLTGEGIRPGLSESDKKIKSAFGASEALIDVLENRFTEAKGGEYTGLGAIVRGIPKNIAGSLQLDVPASVYNRERRGFTAALRQITQDVGMLTEKDYQRISELIPKFTDDPVTSKRLFEDLRTMMAAKFSGQPSTSKYLPPESRGGLFEALAPSLAGEYKSQQKEVESSMQGLQTGGGYGNYLKDILGITGRAQFQPSMRKVGAAGEVLTYLGLARGAKGLISKVKGAFTPGSTLANSRAAIAKDVTLDPKKLLEAGDRYVSDINPAAAKTWETLKPAVERTKTVPELLEKLTDWGSKAYTRGGDKRAITEGLLKDYLYGTGRQLIKDVAPQVANITTKMAQNLSRRELLGFLGKTGAAAATTGISFALLNRLLGQQNRQ